MECTLAYASPFENDAAEYQKHPLGFLQKKAASQDEELGILWHENGDLRGLVNEQANTTALLTEEKATLTEENATLKQQLVDLRQKDALAEQQNDILSKKTQAEQEENVGLKHQLIDVEVTAEDKIAAYKKKYRKAIKELKERQKQLQKALERAETMLHALEAKDAKQQAEIEKRQVEVETLMATVKDLKMTINVLRRDLDSVDGRWKRAKKQLAKCKKGCEAAEEKTRQTESVTKQLLEKLDKLTRIQNRDSSTTSMPPLMDRKRANQYRLFPQLRGYAINMICASCLE